jgi:hypothetical protein
MLKFPYKKWEVLIHTAYISLLLVYYAYQYQFIARKQAVKVTPSYLGMRDSHDIQWEAFRNSIPTIVVLALGWKLVGTRHQSYLFGIFLCVFTFRADCIIYFTILLIYYLFVSKYYTRKRFESYVWVFSICMLVLHEYSGRYRFISNAMEPYIPIDWFKNSKHVIHWGSLFNMTMLKLISFAIDVHRSHAHS